MYLDQVIARLVEQDVDTQEFQPCSEQEVQELEQQLERQLPAAYREFLLTMGHGAGEMFQADDCFYGDLPKIQRLANILLAQNNVATPLPADAFVFLYAGYQFLFFRTGEGDDPPTYYYMEGDEQTNTFPRTFEHYSEFLASAIEEYL